MPVERSLPPPLHVRFGAGDDPDACEDTCRCLEPAETVYPYDEREENGHERLKVVVQLEMKVEQTTAQAMPA